MGGLVSGIFDLMSGDPTKQQQDQLNDLSGFETGVGKGATTAANDYYGGILSGDPAQVAMTLAPEIKANQDQAQQKKNSIAQFGTRSGGSTAAGNNIDAASRGNIIDLIGRERSNAAGAEAGLGTNLLSQSSGNINNSARLATNNQQRLSSDVGGIANGAGEIAADIFTGGAASAIPGADPYQTLYSASHAGPVDTLSSDTSSLGLLQ